MRSGAGEFGAGVMDIKYKITRMSFGIKRYHDDSGILGRAEYELKISNNDKKVSRRRLDRISIV